MIICVERYKPNKTIRSHWDANRHEWVKRAKPGAYSLYDCPGDCNNPKCDRDVWIKICDMADDYHPELLANVSELVKKMFGDG